MSRKQTILKGTFILTATGLITRVMGFFYRIFLSHTFGESGVGMYQLIFPVYALGFSLTSAGIELALSRCVSKYITLNNKRRAREMLYTSIFLTLFLSISFLLLLQHYSAPIAFHYLHNPETEELLLLLSYAFPFAAIHSCIVGYYLGFKNTRIPAISQLFEQSFRILSVFLFYRLSTIYLFRFKIVFAVLGLIIGEIAACLFCLKAVTGKFLKFHPPTFAPADFISCSKELLILSFPVTGSRVLLNILQSIEAISIPLSLENFGMSAKEALSTYGVLTGMALPCILFPSAITNAVSTMLLPTVAEIQTVNDYRTLMSIIKKTIISCTFLGIICCVSFLLFGKTAGKIMFNSALASQFIITLAWICPFLYTNNTLISIINGIGKTGISFIINVLNLSIRIVCIFFIIPQCGIYGYLIGLLLSQAFVFLSCIFYLYKLFKAEE